LLQALNEEAQKQRRGALSSIADLESRIQSMQLEHQTTLEQTRASHAREMDQALAAQGAALKTAKAGEPTLAAPVEMNKFPSIAAVISNKSTAEALFSPISNFLVDTPHVIFLADVGDRRKESHSD
jgi:TolA-binding protein